MHSPVPRMLLAVFTSFATAGLCLAEDQGPTTNPQAVELRVFLGPGRVPGQAGIIVSVQNQSTRGLMLTAGGVLDMAPSAAPGSRVDARRRLSGTSVGASCVSLLITSPVQTGIAEDALTFRASTVRVERGLVTIAPGETAAFEYGVPLAYLSQHGGSISARLLAAGSPDLQSEAIDLVAARDMFKLRETSQSLLPQR